MIRALGWSQDDFDPSDPGRLCRGRERWVESFDLTDPPRLERLVISGSAFSDDSARDAQRGVRFSGVQVGPLVRELFGEKQIIACAEDAHPGLVPPGAGGVEHYQITRPGQGLYRWCCRWSTVCETGEDVAEALEAGADVFLILPPDAVLEPGVSRSVADAPLADAAFDKVRETAPLPEDLRQALFLLTGSRVDSTPSRQFQAAALPTVLGLVEQVVLAHRDKHGTCLGIYGQQPVDAEALLRDAAAEQGALAVPFAIPPMLARWDRALWELRQDWDTSVQGEFPVPPAPPGSGWGRRSTERGREE